MSFLTPDQQKALGPLLGVFYFVLALAAGVAINTMAGGPTVPFISPLSGIILGVVTFFVVHKQLRD